MASPAIIDFDALLAPISEDLPTGSDCRDNASPASNYQQIKSARNAARAAERNNIFGGVNHEADEHWRKVMDLAPKVLMQESKDLEVASWYSEAMIRRHGFRGLRDAFELIFGLIDRFWDHLYPMPDEDGLETRVAPLIGLNGQDSDGVLIVPIRNALVTQGNSVGPYTYWEYHQAADIQRTADDDARQDKAKKLGFSLEDVEKAVAETSADFMVHLRDDLSQCIERYRSISQRLDELCGIHDAPPTSNIINVLSECLSAVVHLGQHKFPTEEAPMDITESADGSAPSAAPAEARAAGGPIATRDQAFKQLLEIAEFFRKTEPHSPVSYVVEKAVKWGKMPLAELMQELISDKSALGRYGELTGVKTDD